MSDRQHDTPLAAPDPVSRATAEHYDWGSGEVAPGAAHQARNVAAAPTEFLVVSQPPSHGDRHQ